MPGEDNGNKSEGYKLTEDPAFQELQKAMKGLGIMVTQQQQASTKTQESLNALMGKLDKVIDGDHEGSRHISREEEEEALNDLDNNQLVKLILGEVGKVLDEKVGKIGEKVDQTNSRLSTAEIKQQIIDLNAKDFFDWKDEMSALAKENPSLTPKQLYSLVRTDNPDKAAELDEKYRDKSDDDKGKKFLGLMPTSGATMDADDEKLTAKEAGERAWEDIVDEFPELAAGDG